MVQIGALFSWFCLKPLCYLVGRSEHLFQDHLIQASILVKQKIYCLKHNHVEEAATNLGTFELISCKEVLKGAFCLI